MGVPDRADPVAARRRRYGERRCQRRRAAAAVPTTSSRSRASRDRSIASAICQPRGVGSGSQHRSALQHLEVGDQLVDLGSSRQRSAVVSR